MAQESRQKLDEPWSTETALEEFKRIRAQEPDRNDALLDEVIKTLARKIETKNNEVQARRRGAQMLALGRALKAAESGSKWVKFGHWMEHFVNRRRDDVEYELRYKKTSKALVLGGSLTRATLGAGLTATVVSSGLGVIATPLIIAGIAGGCWCVSQVEEAVLFAYTNKHRLDQIKEWGDRYKLEDDLKIQRYKDNKKITNKSEPLKMEHLASDALRHAVDHFRKANQTYVEICDIQAKFNEDQGAHCGDAEELAATLLAHLHQVKKAAMYLLPCVDLGITIIDGYLGYLARLDRCRASFLDDASKNLSGAYWGELSSYELMHKGMCGGQYASRMTEPLEYFAVKDKTLLQHSCQCFHTDAISQELGAELDNAYGVEPKAPDLAQEAMRKVWKALVTTRVPLSDIAGRAERLSLDQDLGSTPMWLMFFGEPPTKTDTTWNSSWFAENPADSPGDSKRLLHLIQNAFTRRTKFEIAFEILFPALKKGPDLVYESALGAGLYEANVAIKAAVPDAWLARLASWSVSGSISATRAVVDLLGTKLPTIINSVAYDKQRNDAIQAAKDNPISDGLKSAGKKISEDLFTKAAQHLVLADKALRQSEAASSRYVPGCQGMVLRARVLAEAEHHLKKAAGYTIDAMLVVNAMVTTVFEWSDTSGETFVSCQKVIQRFLNKGASTCADCTPNPSKGRLCRWDPKRDKKS